MWRVGLNTSGQRLEHSSPAPHLAIYLYMRLLLNIIWFVLAGLWIAIGYTFAALICFVLIITIPFGIASLRIALGREIVSVDQARALGVEPMFGRGDGLRGME
jgi:hypothetical protein